MRHRFFLTAMFLLSWFCPLAQAQTMRHLFVTHTNDTHSCIDPLPAHHPDAGKGGFVRRAALVDSLRAQHPDMLLLDCGDFSQGSLYYSLFRGEAEVTLFNHMHYDACAIGNHEFDFGLDNMAHLIRLSHFPWLCCNYDFSGTPCQGLVRPYAVVKRGDLRIGIVGVSPRLEGLVSRQSYEGVTFIPPTEAVQPVVDHLREREGCQFIICLSHLGWLDGPEGDDYLIRHSHGIDAVLGGHTHTYLTSPLYIPNTRGHEIPYSQMGKHGRFVGTLEFLLEVLKSPLSAE